MNKKLFLKKLQKRDECYMLGYVPLNSHESHGHQNLNVIAFGNHREFQDVIWSVFL